MVKVDPILCLLFRPMLTRKLGRWLLLIIKFDIVCATLSTIKGQVVIDMIPTFSVNRDIPLLQELPHDICHVYVQYIMMMPFNKHFS